MAVGAPVIWRRLPNGIGRRSTTRWAWISIVDLYLTPPDKAMVLYVDEKTQIQELDRT